MDDTVLEDAEDQEAVRLAVSQCLRVMRRHGVTGAVVASRCAASSRGAVSSGGETVDKDFVAPQKAADMIAFCAEVRGAVEHLRAGAIDFRDMLERCKDAWERTYADDKRDG